MWTSENAVNTKFREYPFWDCLKRLISPDKKLLEAYEPGRRGLISLRYASDFYPRDTTERHFRQFLYEVG
jgi:hypothetical protein